LGKNVSDDYKLEICSLFNRDDKYQALIIDLGEDLSNLEITTESATILFGEVFWDPEKM
jgi:hypothetical protein